MAANVGTNCSGGNWTKSAPANCLVRNGGVGEGYKHEYNSYINPKNNKNK